MFTSTLAFTVIVASFIPSTAFVQVLGRYQRGRLPLSSRTLYPNLKFSHSLRTGFFLGSAPLRRARGTAACPATLLRQAVAARIGRAVSRHHQLEAENTKLALPEIGRAS